MPTDVFTAELGDARIKFICDSCEGDNSFDMLCRVVHRTDENDFTTGVEVVPLTQGREYGLTEITIGAADDTTQDEEAFIICPLCADAETAIADLKALIEALNE